MSRLLTIPVTGSAGPGIRRRTLRRTAIAVGPVSVQFIVILVGALVGLFYLVQSNSVSTDSLQLKALEGKKTLLAEQNERLQVEAARLQSIQVLKKSNEETKQAQKGAASAVAASGPTTKDAATREQ